MVPFGYHLPVRTLPLTLKTYKFIGPKSTFDVTHQIDLKVEYGKVQDEPCALDLFFYARPSVGEPALYCHLIIFAPSSRTLSQIHNSTICLFPILFSSQ